MNTNKMSKNDMIADAASEAVFIYQLPTNQAIRFITSNVRGVSKDEASKAVKSTVVKYKSRA